MITIRRLLTYRFKDKEAAIASLNGRAVKGTQIWGNNEIREAFYYYDSPQASDVIAAVTSPVFECEPPVGYQEVTNEPR